MRTFSPLLATILLRLSTSLPPSGTKRFDPERLEDEIWEAENDETDNAIWTSKRRIAREAEKDAAQVRGGWGACCCSFSHNVLATDPFIFRELFPEAIWTT
jgi:hypothetical protein